MERGWVLIYLSNPRTDASRSHGVLAKLHLLKAHIKKSYEELWVQVPGCKGSLDAQTIGFYGRHARKLRITYKRETGSKLMLIAQRVTHLHCFSSWRSWQ